MKLETSLELLERVRSHLGNVSYYRVAKILELDPGTVLRWKAGKAGMGRDIAPRIAALLGEAPEYVLACIECEREQSADVRKIWRPHRRGLPIEGGRGRDQFDRPGRSAGNAPPHGGSRV